MSRSFYVSGFRDDRFNGRDAWVETEVQMRQEGGRHPGADELPLEEVPILGPDGKQAIHPLTGKPRTRRVRKDSALGFESGDVHYAGDRVVKIAEEVEIQGGEATGRILYRFARVGEDGRLRGTYVQPWEKVAEGRYQQAGKAKRYFT
jgi:hypothetical protein